MDEFVQESQGVVAGHSEFIDRAEACDWIHEMKDGRIVASHARSSQSSTS